MAHYCNIPYHLLTGEEGYQYSKTDVDELFIGAQHLIRNFELAPYAQADSLEEQMIARVKDGRI